MKIGVRKKTKSALGWSKDIFLPSNLLIIKYRFFQKVHLSHLLPNGLENLFLICNFVAAKQRKRHAIFASLARSQKNKKAFLAGDKYKEKT